jgi:endonuclease/exonuclease/phosphatase family metal-dependent hydrolase
MIVDHIIAKSFSLHTPLVIAGDFNDWNKVASSYFEEKLEMHETFKKNHGIYPCTFPSLFPFFCLDRIYVKNCSVLSAVILDHVKNKKLSDHFALLSEVEIE